MKLRPIYIIVLLISVFAAACGPSSTPAAIPPTSVPPTSVPPTALPPPTQASQGSGDPVWDRVVSSGKIVFGTSADYEPFEYYDNNYQITGFDPSIARELGVRLGLQVEIKDIPFDGLYNALQTGQIDAVIAAVTVTVERQSILDFTNVYYSGQEIMLARQGSGIAKLTSPVQLAPYRVGVQRGTVYQKWIQTSLVDTGLMPSTNLLAYAEPEHAISDLKENRNDIVVMDSVPGQHYLSEGGLEVVGSGLHTQVYAIALPKGSSVFQSQLNNALIQLQNSGTIAALADTYLKVELAGTPIPLPTPMPYPTATQPPCYNDMAFVSDVTIPDGTEMSPGQKFYKVWRIKNIGTCSWDSSYHLVFVQGNPMGGVPQAVKNTVKPGETYDMGIDLTAPTTPGKYGSEWQMVDGRNFPFGTRLWVKITVPGPPAPTATAVPPTATPLPPTAQPTAQPSSTPYPPPTISSFTADPTMVDQGGLVTLSWEFSGNDIATSRLVRTDPDGTQTILNFGSNLLPADSFNDYPLQAGDVVYTLVVNNIHRGTTTATVEVTVNALTIWQ